MNIYRRIRKLTTDEEMGILNAILIDGNYNREQGSSRIVLISLGNETMRTLVSYNINPDCVIKVNVGYAGCVQSEQEREAYQSATEDQVKHLADIYAYGKVIQIMEKLDLCSFASRTYRDVFDCMVKVECDGYYINKEKVRAYFDEVVGDLDGEDGWDCDNILSLLIFMIEDFEDYLDTMFELVGDTGDNYQLGITSDYKIKSYDYGYFEDSTRDNCCFDGDTYSIYLEDYVGSIISAAQVGCNLDPDLLQEIAVDM